MEGELLDALRRERKLIEEKKELKRQIRILEGEVRDRSSPPRQMRKRSRSPRRRDSDTDIFVGNWRSANVDFDSFREFVKERYNINIVRVITGKTGNWGRLVLKDAQDQIAFLENKGEISKDFNLNGVKISNE